MTVAPKSFSIEYRTRPEIDYILLESCQHLRGCLSAEPLLTSGSWRNFVGYDWPKMSRYTSATLSTLNYFYICRRRTSALIVALAFLFLVVLFFASDWPICWQHL